MRKVQAHNASPQCKPPASATASHLQVQLQATCKCNCKPPASACPRGSGEEGPAPLEGRLVHLAELPGELGANHLVEVGDHVLAQLDRL